MSAAITINYRNPSLTIECVDSLLEDGWSPILVWDNSGDDGKSMLAIEAYFEHRLGVVLVRNQDNLGFAAGMNRALGALGKLGYAGPVLLINNDARVKVGLRDALTLRLNANLPPTIIAPKIDQAGQEHGWMYYQPWLGLVSEQPLWGCIRYLSGCCLLVHRELNDHPLFDESFFMYGEDVELCCRVNKMGGRLILLDEVYVFHLGSSSSGPATIFYERQLVRAHVLLADKLAIDPFSKTVMRALRLPVLISRACLRGIRFRSVTPIQALAAIFH